MRVKIGDTIYNTDNEPIMLIFDNDDSRKTVAKHLTEMPEKDGIRKYVMFDAELSKDVVTEFMKIS
jgi:hypothetical protein